MPTPIQSFIQNYLTLDENQRRRDDQRLRQTATEAEMLGLFQRLGSQTTNPEALQGLADQLSLNPDMSEAVRTVIMNSIPEMAVQQAGLARTGAEGIEGLPGAVAARGLAGTTLSGLEADRFGYEALRETPDAIRENLQNAFRSTTLTGMTPDQLAISSDVAGRAPGQLRDIADIQVGLSLSAPQAAQDATTRRGQDLSYASSMAGNRLGWAQLIQQGALAEAAQELEAQNLELRRNIASGAADPMQLQLEHGPGLLDAHRKLSDWLQSERNNLSRAEIESAVANLQNINDMMQSIGMHSVDISNLVPADYVRPRLNRRIHMGARVGHSDAPGFRPGQIGPQPQEQPQIDPQMLLQLFGPQQQSYLPEGFLQALLHGAQ